MEKMKPYFFQIVIGDYLTHKVKIPPLFMKHLSKDMCKEKTTTKATIKSVHGFWEVKLRKTTTYTYIEDGWPKVMKENSLGDNEFLIFRYDGQMRFNLQIFDKTGCERIHSTTILSNNNIDQRISHKFEENNPHCKLCMKGYNVISTFVVRFPKDFARRISSGSGKFVIQVENSKGEAWDVNVSWNSGTYYLCGGWRSFVLANKLKIGDEYVFELIGKKRIRVHKS